MLKQETQQAILNLQKQYPQRRSALIPALHIAQAEIGCIPPDLQEEIARLFDIETSEVHAIVTFYDMFYEKPIGKHVIHVCKNVSCMLRGCDNVLKALCDHLQVIPGETDSNGEFTVIASECLGACDKAPMMLVDEKVIGPVEPAKIEELINEARKGHGHPSPITAAEVSHA
jgi:NADH-quinone oxidoreductase subunit E